MTVVSAVGSTSDKATSLSLKVQSRRESGLVKPYLKLSIIVLYTFANRLQVYTMSVFFFLSFFLSFLD